MINSTNADELESELIQICTDLYYECKTIKELDRLTDKVLDLVKQEVLKAVREERLHNAKFYTDKLKPITKQLEHDVTAMTKELNGEKHGQSNQT